MMKMPVRCMLVACSLLVALVSVACDRRDLQPRQESETTDSVILDPAATDPTTTVNPLPPPATSPCAGLSGREEVDCRARERERRGEMSRPGDTQATDEDPRQ